MKISLISFLEASSTSGMQENMTLDTFLTAGIVCMGGYTSDIKGLHIISQLDNHIRDKWNHHEQSWKLMN